jgi:hypothetical protein
VHGLQEAISSSQVDAGVLELPDWDQASLDGCRSALLALGPYTPSGRGRFGDVHDVDPIKHLVSTATGWGGNPPAAAMYFAVYPDDNDGSVPYTLALADVPVDGFWSVAV